VSLKIGALRVCKVCVFDATRNGVNLYGFDCVLRFEYVFVLSIDDQAQLLDPRRKQKGRLVREIEKKNLQGTITNLAPIEDKFV